MADEKNAVMSEELAENEFSRWAEENDINTDVGEMNEDEKKSFGGMKKKIVKSIASGQTVVNDGGSLEVTLGKSNPEGYAGNVLTFKAPSAQAYLGIDNFKDNQNIHKMVAVMSAMTGKDISYFSKICIKDFKLFIVIATFFLAD